MSQGEGGGAKPLVPGAPAGVYFPVRVPGDVAARLQRAAGDASVSSWVRDAVRRRLGLGALPTLGRAPAQERGLVQPITFGLSYQEANALRRAAGPRRCGAYVREAIAERLGVQ